MKLEDLAAAPPARLPFPITRALAPAIECRAAEDPAAMPTMVGHFSTFGDWYEVDSWIEGHFLESVGKGAFTKTIAEGRDQMKSLFDHGQDPQIGNKVLGPIEDLRVDKIGPAFAVPLFDTSYNRDLRPGLEAGVYGSSFRFTVEKDAWNREPDASAYNPKALPERTITEARVFEFGPVTFPANPAATAGVRSTTDTFYQRSRDPEAFETLLRSAQAARTPIAGAAAQPPEPPSGTPQEPPRSDTLPAVVEPATVAVIPDTQEYRTVEYITRDEKVARISELKDIQARTGVEYPGVFPPDVQAQWDAYTKEQDDLERDVAAWDTRQARLAANAQNARVVETPAQPVPFNVMRKQSDADIFDVAAVWSRARSTEERSQIFRDNAMHIVERMRFANPNVQPHADQARTNLADLLDHDTQDHQLAQRLQATGSPIYTKAFLAKAQGRELTPEEQRGTALAMNVVGTGGYLVPAVMDPTLIGVGAWNTNPVRAVARKETLVGSNEWRALTAAAVVATRAEEATAATEQGPALLQPTIIPTKVQGQITYSIETGEDRPDLGSEMARLIAEAKDTEEEAIFTLGIGDTLGVNVNPIGVLGTHAEVTLSYAHIHTIGDGVFAIADVDAVYAALPLRFRRNAVWLMSIPILGAIKGFEGVNGRLFGGTNYASTGVQGAPSLTGDTGLRLLGRPVYESPSGCAAIADLANKMLLTLFDPQTYCIVDRVGMNVEFIPFLSAATVYVTGQRALYFYWRNSARPLFPTGGVRLAYT